MGKCIDLIKYKKHNIFKRGWDAIWDATTGYDAADHYKYIYETARRAGVDPRLVMAIINLESNTGGHLPLTHFWDTGLYYVGASGIRATSIGIGQMQRATFEAVQEAHPEVGGSSWMALAWDQGLAIRATTYRLLDIQQVLLADPRSADLSVSTQLEYIAAAYNAGDSHRVRFGPLRGLQPELCRPVRGLPPQGRQALLPDRAVPMLRRVVMVAAGVFVAGGLVFVAGLVYVVVRPEEGGVKAARQLTERVVTPATMRFVDAGTDQKTPYRDFVIADSDVDQLSEVRPPRGYRLQKRFRNGAGPFPFGDSLMVAEWSGPDPRDDGHKECMIFLERTTSTPRDDAPSKSGAAVEGSDQTKVRLSAVCEID